MRNLIKQILKEETSDERVLKNYILKVFQKQVDSGLTPHIPYQDLKRKKLTMGYIELIDSLYFKFLEEHYDVSNSFEKIKTFFHNAIKNVTDEDLKKSGIDVGNDKFSVSIPWIELNQNYDKINEVDVEFGFIINDCHLSTDDGMKTYEEMLSDDVSDNIWNDVTIYLRGQIEDYVDIKGLDFGLDVFESNSYWAD